MKTNRINIKSVKLMLVTALVSALFFSACKKNNYSVDLESTPTAPTASQFVPINGVLRVDYFVRNGGPALKIPVGITNVSGQDREVKLTYTSRNAQSGVQYNAPSSITIKAGAAIDTLNFQGIFAGYPTGRKDTVKIKFSGIPGVERKDSFEVVIQAYCDVVLANLVGAYTRTNEYNNAGAYSWGPYTAGVRDLVATGATTAEGYFMNLYDYGWSDLKFTINWTTPGAFTVSVPLQAVNSPASGVSFVRTSSGKVNTFSSCDNTFTISLDLLDANQAVLATGYQFRLAK